MKNGYAMAKWCMALAAAFWLAFPAIAAQSSSANFTVSSSLFANGGGQSSSASYRQTGMQGYSFSQVDSSSTNYRSGLAISTLLPVIPTLNPPSAFIFTPQSNVAASALATSNTITVAGIAAQSPISPISIASCDSTQCEYKINNGAWTNAPSFVSNGDTVQVRLLTGAYATESHLALDIGGVMGFFTASTPGAPATVKFAAPAYSVVAGTPTVVLSVTRTVGTGAASVAYATANGTATAGLDYTAKTGTLSWLAGDTTAKTITVPILNPASGINKTFGVTLSNPTGAALGTPASATVSILDRSNTVQFNPATLSVSEAAGAAVLTVSRSGSTAGAVSVNYVTANGTALTGSDYLASSGTLIWNDGDGADKTISVPIINDSLTEAVETFTITLSNPVGALLGTAKTATVTIADGDSAIQFSVASASVAESVVSGNITLIVTRTGTRTDAASATYSTADGTATAGSDYTATSGTINWGAGDATAKPIIVPILNDSVVEGSETFKVNLTSAVGATLGANKAVTVTITDNDTGAGVLQFSASNYVFKENGVNASLAATRTGGSPGAVLTVTRTGGSLGAVSVAYATTPGSATAGADYTSKTGTLSWLTGDVAAKTILVPIINDIVAEPTETFTVALSNAAGGATLGAVNAATVSIIDDDTPAVVGIQFDTRKYTVLENAGVATLTVNRDPANAANAAMVSYAASNGTAMAGADYVTQTGSLIWPAGDSTPRTITVPIINNTVAEVTKSFNVTLSNAAGNTLGAIPVATVTIIDDDEIFPPGGQTPAGWSMPVAADRGWYVSWGQFQAGVASLRSGNVLDGQKAQTEVTRNFQNGMVSFSIRVSSETNADFLRFYIDGVKKGEWSGIQTLWTTVNYPLVAGSHTLRWSYEKDGSLMAGADGAWIDTVSLPAEQ